MIYHSSCDILPTGTLALAGSYTGFSRFFTTSPSRYLAISPSGHPTTSPKKGVYMQTLIKVRSILQKRCVAIWGNKAVIPGDDWSLESIAIKLIECSEKYSVELALAIAQGIVECHFGVHPAASRSRRTKNIYNVGNVDDGSSRQMKSYAEGIETYFRLMSREYRWPEDANGYVTIKSMITHNFCRPKGGRYATAPNYTEMVASVAKAVQNDLNS